MVYVNDTACNGCGVCSDICSTGALIFQNHRAYIDQELCQECEACVSICPQGAILCGEMNTISQEVIRVPSVLPAQSDFQEKLSERIPIREVILPTISSILLWTGRELVPRLADLAIRHLDRRMQTAKLVPNQTGGIRQFQQASKPIRRRRQRRRGKVRFIRSFNE